MLHQLINHRVLKSLFNSLGVFQLVIIKKVLMKLIIWQYLKMASFSESIMTLLIVSENCLQHSLELGNCEDGYYADANSSVFELL